MGWVPKGLGASCAFVGASRVHTAHKYYGTGFLCYPASAHRGGLKRGSQRRSTNSWGRLVFLLARYSRFRQVYEPSLLSFPCPSITLPLNLLEGSRFTLKPKYSTRSRESKRNCTGWTRGGGGPWNMGNVTDKIENSIDQLIPLVSNEMSVQIFQLTDKRVCNFDWWVPISAENLTTIFWTIIWVRYLTYVG